MTTPAMDAVRSLSPDSAVFSTAVFCTLWGIGAGVFFAIHEYVGMAIFLALALVTWLSTRYALHRH
ncbi:MAG TPA: hypothetical protein VFB50_19520 [Chloroflexota bacterium]|nr:hypothetical protein [Chloroflexota bacterium]